MNTQQNFNDYLFHASAYSKLTTEPKSAADKAAGNLSATTKEFLKQIFLEQIYGRRKEITSKHMEKGTLQEEAAITLYCRVTKKLYKKNKVRVKNDFVTGEPDLVDNEDIYKTEEGVDIKCSWSVFSFPFADDELSKDYKWQNQNYMYLTGAKRWKTAFCLVNAPAYLINDEKRRAFYKAGSPDEDNNPVEYARYIEDCIEIEKNMIFNLAEFKEENPNYDLDIPLSEWVFDIPLKERIIEFVTERDDFLIASIEPAVIKGRQFLNSLVKKQTE